MPNTKFGAQDLGRRPPIDREALEPGVIIWDRFCVVTKRPADEYGELVVVSDLERVLGRPPNHLLGLHLLDMPATPDARARLRRAVTAGKRTQLEVLALAEAGDQLPLLCEPIGGRALDEHGLHAIGPGGVIEQSAPLDARKLFLLASELAALLSQLHTHDVTGVRFARHQLRVVNGRFGLDSFEHLCGSQARDPQRDLNALFAFLRTTGGDALESLLEPEPSSARELWQRAQAQAGHTRFDDITLPSEPPFVGRERALSTLGDGLANAHIAQPSAIIVRGNRGVGKSRLLREFITARLEADDAFVLSGTWQPRSADTRGGLLGALDQLPRALRNLGDEEREAVRHRLNRATRNLGAIVTRTAPSLGGVLRAIEELPPLELSGDFSRHTAVIADLLRAIGTQKRPLVLILDNLERADSRSLQVLKILTQPRPAHHTLIVAGVRDSPNTYNSEFETETFTLAPLTTEEVSQLLSRTLPGDIAEHEILAQTLVSVSHGYPLAVWANLRAWLDRGLLIHEVGEATWRARESLQEEANHEPDVRELFGFRLSNTSPEVRQLVLDMAVLGTDLNLVEIRELAEAPHGQTAAPIQAEDLDEALEDLVARGIITPTDIGFRFPHDSIRELVLESADAAQRRASHIGAATLLASRDAPVAQIAYHRDLGFDSEAASAEDSDKLSSLHVEAGSDRLAVYDLERARWHLERALEHSQNPDQRSLAAEALADVCLLSGDYNGAVELYTALIGGSDQLHALRAASKATYFLFFKAAVDDAQLIADMALEVVGEPLPKGTFSKVLTIIGALFSARFRRPPYPVELRDSLCALYPILIALKVASDPLMVGVYLTRARWMARGLNTGNAATVLAFEASIRATLGSFRVADKLFTQAMEISNEVQDSWSRGIVAHNWGHTSLLPSNRYDEGQDMLDDALADFRETGDMSVALLTLTYKAIYGRDREPADTLLGWLDEAMAMAHRNAKELILTSLESIRLAILARQGRTDIIPRVRRAAQTLTDPAVPIPERIISHSHLALAAFELGERKLADEQIIAGNAIIAELPGVPEFCQEIHATTVFVILGHQLPSRAERKLLRRAQRQLKRSAKLSPRLAVLHELSLLKQALGQRDDRRAGKLAASLIGGFEIHGNIYATREAHRALAQIIKAENVLAAAEHERLARNFGRRLGLDERALFSEFSDFSELSTSSSMLALEGSSARYSDDPNVPAAGILTPGPHPLSVRERIGHEHEEILEAWALTGRQAAEVELRDIIDPVREAVSNALTGATLEMSCSPPDTSVTLAKSDLQVLLTNLVLSCRDTVGSGASIRVELEIEELKTNEGNDRGGRFTQMSPGRYLTIVVRARGQGTQVPVLGGFSTCEGLFKAMDGELSASTDRARVNLVGRIPLDLAPVSPSPAQSYGKVLLVHKDAAIRATLSTALADLGIMAIEFEPDDFEAGELEGASVVFADSRSLRSLQVFEPLIDARIIEVVQPGREPVSPERATLRIPFAVSELTDMLQR